MDDFKTELTKHDLVTRWKQLDDQWNILFPQCEGLWIENGDDNPDTRKAKAVGFQRWLLRFDWSNSVTIITKNVLILFISTDRLEFYTHFAEKAKLEGKEVILIPLKEQSMSSDLNASSLFREVKKLKLAKFGVIGSDQHHGKLIEFTQKFRTENSISTCDVDTSLQELLSVKSTTDRILTDKSSKITSYLFSKLLKNILNAIENSKEISHSQFTKQLLKDFDSSRKEISKDLKVITSFYDIVIGPVIQSGSGFDFRLNAISNNQILSQDCIVFSMGGNYLGLNSFISRSLIINPEDQDKENYIALFQIHNYLISKMKIGNKISDVFEEVMSFANSKFPNLVNKLPQNFGFGIGYEFRENCLIIKAGNKHEIKEGQVFAIVSSFKDLKGFKKKEYSLLISDTIEIRQDQPVVLTEKIPNRFEEIAFTFDEVEEIEDIKEEKPFIKISDEPIIIDISRDVPKKKRKRFNLIEDYRKLDSIRKHQNELLQMKIKEMKDRFNSGEFFYSSVENDKLQIEKLQTYSTGNFPKGLNPHFISVDAANSAVLVPINGGIVPFHIACIKNVVKFQEGSTFGMRINFNIPGIAANIIYPSQNSQGPEIVYLKEFNFRSSNTNQLNLLLKQIKDLQKKQKIPSMFPEIKEETINLKDRVKILNEVKMRPPLSGKKSVGVLTGFSNGLRFSSKKNEVFDISLKNIKNAIFQRCDDKLIVLIHFVLKSSIIINKKLTNHVQFFTEVTFAAEDLHDPRILHFSEVEGVQEELLEQRAREHFNAAYFDFVSSLEKGWENAIRFEIPTEKFGFVASYNYNNVFVMPTSSCLISLIETPFLVVNLDDIELVSIERVDNNIKNFDMVIILKDYSKSAIYLNCIEKSKLQAIREWLNNQSILFMDGGVRNIKWDNLLKKIRSDPKQFIAERGWAAFFEEEDEDENDKSFDENEPDVEDGIFGEPEEVENHENGEEDGDSSFVDDDEDDENEDEEDDDSDEDDNENNKSEMKHISSDEEKEEDSDGIYEEVKNEDSVQISTDKKIARKTIAAEL